jgi:hypothetical protein
MKPMKFTARIAAIAAVSLLTVTAAEASPAGTLYEAFATQTFSLDLGTLTETGSVSARATHLAAAGDYVFWQDDIRVWRARKDLTEVTNIWTNLRAPSDITVDPTGTYLYEAFSTQLFTLDLRTLTEVAGANVQATHLTAAGDYLFWQDDIRIWRAKSNLTEITNIWTNLRAPTDIVVDPSGRYLYEAFATQLFSLDLDTLTEVGSANVQATHLAATSDHIFWQDDIRVWRATSNLTEITNIWTNLRAPTDIAVGTPPATTALPETPTLLLLAAALLACGLFRRGDAI